MPEGDEGAVDLPQRHDPGHQGEDGRETVYTATQIWAGPIPPAFELANLDRVVPGLAREIADEFRTEAAHRRKIENRRSAESVAGMVLGYLMAAGFAGLCVATIWHAIDAKAFGVAGTIAAVALVGGISAFLGIQASRRRANDGGEPPEGNE